MALKKLFSLFSFYPPFFELLSGNETDTEPSRLRQSDRYIRVLRNGRTGYFGLFLDRDGKLAARQYQADRLRYLLDFKAWLGTEAISTVTPISDIGARVSLVQSTTDQVLILVSNVQLTGDVEIAITTTGGRSWSVCMRFYERSI